jgi:hypothetical protein
MLHKPRGRAKDIAPVAKPASFQFPLKDDASKHRGLGSTPRCAPLEISKPVTPLRSLGRPLIRAPLPPTRAACPTAPLRSRLLKSPSELKTLGLPPPQTRAPKGAPFGISTFKPPTLGAWPGLALPPCGTRPGNPCQTPRCPEGHARWDFRPPPLRRRFRPATPKAPAALRQAKPPTGVPRFGFVRRPANPKARPPANSARWRGECLGKCFWLETRHHPPTPDARPLRTPRGCA